MDLNIWIGCGRLAMKPMLKTHSRSDNTEGHRCFFRVAITRTMDLGKPRAEQRTNFVEVVTWGNLAKRCAQYLDKGTEVIVVGELLDRSEKQTDETYRRYTNINASIVQFGRASQKNQAASGEQRIQNVQQMVGESVNPGLAALLAAASGSFLPSAPPTEAPSDTPVSEPETETPAAPEVESGKNPF